MTFLKPSLLVPVFAVALSLTGAAFAQAPAQAPDQTQAQAQAPTQPAPSAAVGPQHQPNPAREAKRLSKELGLSADQTAQVEPILADREQRIQTLEANTTLDPKSVKKQRRAIMMGAEQKLNAILTPAQQQQFATLRAERKHAAPMPAPAL